MSTIFTRVLSGQVDVIPGDVRMLSTASPAEVLAPGFLNRVATAANFTIFETDVISAIYGDPQVAAIFKPSLSGGVYTLVPIAGASGESNTSSNVGAGEGLALPKSGVNLPFKSIEAGANIALTPTGNSVIIEAVIPDVGEANTASNVGLGAGVFKQKVGVDLQLKSLANGPGISISNGTNELTITATSIGDITDGNNLGGGEPVFAGKTGSLLDFKTLVAGTNINFSANANELTINSSGGGGSGFDYDNVFWIAKNGNDANNGKSIDAPKLTFASVQSAIVSGIGIKTAIYVLDGGTYDVDNFLFGKQGDFYISAPHATFVYSSGPADAMFYLSTAASTLVGEFGTLNGAGSLYGFRCIGGGGSRIDVTINETVNMARLFRDETFGGFIESSRINVGKIVGSGAQVIFSNGGEQVLTGGDLGTVSVSSTRPSGTGETIVSASIFGGTLGGTADFNLNAGYLDFSTYSSTTTGIVNGVSAGTSTLGGYNGNNFFSDLNLHDSGIHRENYYITFTTPPPTGSWSFVPGFQNGNGQISVTNHNGTITLPPAASVAEGWRMTVAQSDRSSGARIQPQGLDTLCGQPSSTTAMFTGRGKCEIIRGPSNGAGGFTWITTGDIFGSNDFTLNGIYVSSDSGDDALGDGSFQSPLATIGAAVTLAGAPVNTFPIYLVGAQTYDEQVVMPNPNVAIIGPQSVLFSTIGDSLTITSTGGNHPIFLGGLGSSAGRSLVGTQDSVIVTNVSAFIQGAIEINNNFLFIGNSALLDVDINVTGTGFANYSTAQHSGTNTGAVFGIDPTGTTTDWNVAGNLTATGLAYPVADGAAGQFMTTDGAGTLSFATPPSGGLAYVAIAGTSQAAAINTAYLSANPAQTTITLPATAAFGDKVKVYGYGAAGWILQANTGQTINLGTSSTTVAGSLTSVAATDLVEVTCLVANTLWQVDYVYSAGLTVA